MDKFSNIISLPSGVYVLELFVILFIAGLFPSSLWAQEGQRFPMWEEGYLDIHHINTGKGDAAFFVLPDGTTLLVDAGAHTRPPGGPRELDVKPNDSRTPGQWIARYIAYMLQEHEDQRLNYVLLTHFHSDHMGGLYPEVKSSEYGDYKLSGVTEVGEHIPIDKVIDRGWPDYSWPCPAEGDDVDNYRQFLDWHVEHNNMEVEKFRPGKRDQLSLVHDIDAFENFGIRNIHSNGRVWTGVDSNIRSHFPSVDFISEDDLPTENMCSIAFRLSYGSFDYFSGGDLLGVPPPGSPQWHDIETPVAKAVGPVDVNVANHHGHFDAQNNFFISALRPRIHIIQSWVAAHPAPSTLRRMLSENLYPGPRDIFSTNLMEVTKTFIGPSADRIVDNHGHIVIRVDPGGSNYNVFVIDDANEEFRIKEVYGPYVSE